MQSSNLNSEKSGSTNWNQSCEIIALSASNREELKKSVLAIKAKFSKDPSIDSIGSTAYAWRRSFSANAPCRLLLVLEKKDDPIRLFDSVIECIKSRQEIRWTEKSFFYGENTDYGKLAFVFPGQGSQYINMGKEIFEHFPESSQTFQLANEIFNHSPSLIQYIYPDSEGEEEKALLEEKLRSTDVAQPAIGAVSISMLKVLQRFGVIPGAACGHSYGELSALYSSGRINEEAFLSLSILRGKFMAAAGKGKDGGTMLAVKSPLTNIEELLKSIDIDVILANRNSPDQGVLSGPTDAILRMQSILKEHKIRSTLLPVAAAFHSKLVKEAAEPFQHALENFDFHQSKIPVYSNTTGTPYPDSPTDAKKLLGIHLINPVKFIDEIESMYKDGVRIFMEVGPRTILSGLIKSILEGRDFTVIATDGSSGRRSGMTDLAKSLCHLASIGYPVKIEKWRNS